MKITKKLELGRRLEFNFMPNDDDGFGILNLIDRDGHASKLESGFYRTDNIERAFGIACSNHSIEKFPFDLVE